MNKKEVKNIFLKHISTNQNIKIKSVKKIHNGLTNISYLIKTNIDWYQLRFSSNYKNINRKLEQSIFNDNYIYYDDNLFIKKWIKGKTLKNKDIIKNLDLINQEIIKFHKLNIDKKNVFKINFLEVIDNKFKYDDLYKKINNYFLNDELVISHNDVNNKNIIIDTNNNIHLIDFEWVSLNYYWFDFVYLLVHSKIRNSKLLTIANKYYKNININHLFFVAYFCFKWIEQTNKKSLKFHLLKKRYWSITNYFAKKILLKKK